jgi:hypothetical protein
VVLSTEQFGETVGKVRIFSLVYIHTFQQSIAS